MKKDKAWAKEQLDYYIKAVGDPFNSRTQGMIDAYKNVEHIINQLDEPQKPIIPQFVADWIESQDDPIYGMCVNYEMWGVNGDNGTTSFTGEIAEWFDDILNVENYYRACIDGYEVEKEKKYYVDLDTAAYVAKWNGDGSVQIYTDSISGSDEYELHLTEKEIKDYDKRFWAFAVKVEGVG